MQPYPYLVHVERLFPIDPSAQEHQLITNIKLIQNLQTQLVGRKTQKVSFFSLEKKFQSHFEANYIS